MIEEKEEDKSKYKIEYLGEKFSKDYKIYKVIVFGTFGVGKTNIINKLMDKEIKKEYEPTISIDIKSIQVKVNNKIIQIQIWDLCGSNKFVQNTPNIFKNTSIALLVYAINNKEKSFDELKNWYNILKEHSYEHKIFLIGNKSDLEKEREVTIEDAEKFKNNYDDIKIFLETSALNGNNMDKLLDNIAISIYEKDTNDENQLDNAIHRERITLIKKESKKGKKKKKNFC